MDIADKLRCVFSAQVREQDGSYVIEVPKQEITHGDLQSGKVYRTAMFATATDTGTNDSATAMEPKAPATAAETADEEVPAGTQVSEPSGPPVQPGEVREVEIETLGDQGDGIARVERGYVIIVPETEKGDQVRIEITTVRENVAFGDVLE